MLSNFKNKMGIEDIFGRQSIKQRMEISHLHLNVQSLFISGQRSPVDTVSAAVQTNSEASPPPYAVRDLYHCPCTLMEDGVVFQMHIPRCPSYVKDPPNYLDAIQSDEVTVTVQNETEENDTAIEFSVDSSAVA